MTSPPTALPRWLRSPWALVAAIALTYALSLGGGWLAYDDTWLVRDNTLLNDTSWSVPWAIVAHLDRATRLALGAEFLPVRDLVTWLARAWLGLDALGFRVLSLALYASACALLLRFATGLGHEGYVLGAWLFALHPIHAESVAWIAGLKDVLALLFVAAALLSAEERTPRRRAMTALFVALACGSKGAAVIAPGLLFLADVLRGRPQDRVTLAITSAIAGAWALAHAWVGSVVTMYAAPLGEGLVERVSSVAVIGTRYLALSALVHPSSVVYDVDVHGVDPLGVASLALFLTLTLLAFAAWRRGQRWPAALLAFFVVGLLPVSQLVAPLQNRMADRYLLFSLWAPMALLGVALASLGQRASERVAQVAFLATLAVCGALTFTRAMTFADPIALFTEATLRTTESPKAPLLLADTLFARERYEDAEFAYRMAIDRDQFRTDHGRRAGNGLGRILAGTRREREAIELYTMLVARYPSDPRVLHNLATLEAGAGMNREAEAHRRELAERFPDYRPGVSSPGPS